MTSLQQLVMALDREYDGDETAEWVQVMGAVQLHQFERDDNLGSLFGFIAPPECSAIAMSAPGWARRTDLPSARARAGQERVRVTCAVARDGEVAGCIHWADGTVIAESPGSGRSLDLLRRCLGLATDPPEVDPGQLFAAQWLEAIRRMVGRCGRPPGWEQVAWRHPAMEIARDGGVPVVSDDLVEVAKEAAQIWSWSELLHQASRPGALADSLPPGLGGWMDEGMLSRWLLASYPPLADQMARVKALVGPATGRRIEQALEALGLPAQAPGGQAARPSRRQRRAKH